MAQTRTEVRADVRGDVRRYLIASVAGFGLGMTLGFLFLVGLV